MGVHQGIQGDIKGVDFSNYTFSVKGPDKEPSFTKYWEVLLHSGHTVYGPVDLTNERPWVSLKHYIKDSGDKIVRMKLRLCDRTVDALPDQSAYFFITKLIATVGFPTSVLYGIGSSPDKDFEHIKIVFADEHGNSFSEIRERSKCGEGLIVNP